MTRDTQTTTIRAIIAAFALMVWAPTTGWAQVAATAEETFAEAAQFHQARDFLRALALAETAAERGHVRAAVMVGHILEDGLAGAVNDEGAVRFYGMAAEEQDPEALMRLGILARDARGGLTPDMAANFFDRAAQAGHPGARHAQALHYLDPDAPDANGLLGLTMLRRAAADGRVSAQRDLGLALLGRAGVIENGAAADDDGVADIDEALDWLLVAADAGDLQAAYAAGVTLATQDRARAVMLLRQASDAGHGLAAGDLGWLLYVEARTAEEHAEAVTHLRRAALSGDPMGRFRLAWALAEGEGVDQDLEEAYRWLLLAESAGLREADRLARDPARLKYWLERRLTAQQITRVEQSLPVAR